MFSAIAFTLLGKRFIITNEEFAIMLLSITVASLIFVVYKMDIHNVLFSPINSIRDMFEKSIRLPSPITSQVKFYNQFFVETLVDLIQIVDKVSQLKTENEQNQSLPNISITPLVDPQNVSKSNIK